MFNLRCFTSGSLHMLKTKTTPGHHLVTSYWLRCHLSSTISQVNPTKDLDAEFDVILAADVIYPTTGGSLPLLLQILSQ